MIGHLQRNKVKYIAGKVALIHSVDSLRLAKTISEEAVKHNCEIPILIEVNVAGEESKFGVSVEETLPLIEEIAKLPAIHVEGLMTIAPYVLRFLQSMEGFPLRKHQTCFPRRQRLPRSGSGFRSCALPLPH